MKTITLCCLLGALFICLDTRAQSFQTITLLKQGQTYITEPAAVTNLNKPIRIATEDGHTGDNAILLIFRNCHSLPPLATNFNDGAFTFRALFPNEMKADSIVFQSKLNGQFVSLTLFHIPGHSCPSGTSTPSGTTTPSAIAHPSDTGVSSSLRDRKLTGPLLLEPGNLVYDALRLQAALSREEIIQRINYYLGRQDSTNLLLTGADSGNAYLMEYLKNNYDTKAEPTGTAGIFSSFQSFFSGVGGLDVTTLVDGLAKFLVARTKEELETAFFTRFREDMANPAYKDLQILFPATYRKLQAIGVEIYQFDLYKQALREAFASDLKNMLTNLPQVVTDGRFKTWFDQHKEIKATVLSGLYIYNSLAAGKHPGDVIAGYDLSYLDGIHREVPVKGAVQTIQQVSYALRSTSPDHYWASTDNLKMVFKDPDSRAAFMALLWIRAVNVRYGEGGREADSLRGVINILHGPGQQDNVAKFQAFFTDLLERGRGVEATLAALKQKKNIQGASVVYEDYYSLIDQSLDLLGHFSTGMQTLPYIKDIFTVGGKVDFYVARANEINEIGLDIATANYSSAIVTLGSLYDSLTYKAMPVAMAAAPASRSLPASGTSGGSPASGDSDLDRQLIADQTGKQTLKRIIRYGILMAGVVTAKNSDDVQKAIESVALPSGSSRIKRESICNIAVNAFVGLHGGHEMIKNADNQSALNAFGLTAPIGVAFSWGSRPVQRDDGKIIGGKSNGFFVSFIDLGAVTTLRFGDTTTTRLPTIQLQNIVAPGIFYSHGFGKCPLSLNIGVQYGPRLRDIKSTTVTNLDNGYWRVGLSLLVDIPLLNLYNKN